jgi:FG-GAP repeat protein
LKAANTDTNDMFGFSAALSGETAVIGAIWESSNASGIDGNQDNNNLSKSGSVYMFE